jgi:hypothetical protein
MKCPSHTRGRCLFRIGLKDPALIQSVGEHAAALKDVDLLNRLQSITKNSAVLNSLSSFIGQLAKK